MRKRLFRACYAVSAAAGITVALGLGAAGASASVTIHRTHHATPQCVALTAHCVTWAEPGPLGVAITATAGAPNAPVILTQNDTSNPDQDFVVTELGKVTTFYAGGANDLGLNAYDNTEYTNDELVSAEFAPGGIVTDLCLANVNDRLVLRDCNGRRWQTFIETTATPDGMGYGGGNPLSIAIPPGDTLLLSCAHVFDNGEHLAMTGAGTDGTQVTFGHPTDNNDQFWTPVVEP